MINSRVVEAHARGSAESGLHIENTPMPGRVGNQQAINQGKVDFVANYCGTYAAFPSQMFDRRVEILNTLYLGLRAYELSYEAKRQLTNDNDELQFPKSIPDNVVRQSKCYFYQYLPFSSRAAAVIQKVSEEHAEAIRQQVPAGLNPYQAEQFIAARQKSDPEGRKEASKKVSAVKQQTETSMASAQFDTATYDPIRSQDMFEMVGAWTVGRVLDTKAAVHDRYAGGPRDTAFSCMVDVQVAWRPAERAIGTDKDTSLKSGFLLCESEKAGQQSESCLANNHAPQLRSVIGSDFGKNVRRRTSGVQAQMNKAAANASKAAGAAAAAAAAGTPKPTAQQQATPLNDLLKTNFPTLQPLFGNPKSYVSVSSMTYLRDKFYSQMGAAFDDYKELSNVTEGAYAEWRDAKNVPTSKNKAKLVKKKLNAYMKAAMAELDKVVALGVGKLDKAGLEKLAVDVATLGSKIGEFVAEGVPSLPPNKMVIEETVPRADHVESLLTHIDGLLKPATGFVPISMSGIPARL